MKCPKCKAQNKEGVNACRRCGYSLDNERQPSWKWMFGALAVIYTVLILLYVAARILI